MHPAIAIVGLGACLPDAPTPQDFWDNVARGHASHREPPPHRWSAPVDALYAPSTPHADRVLARTGCFITQPAALDPSQLTLPSELLSQMDESLRIALYAAQQALADAGGTLPRQRTDVVLGHIALPTERNAALTQSLLLGPLADQLAQATHHTTEAQEKLARSLRAIAQRPQIPDWLNPITLQDPAINARGTAALPAALIAQAFSLQGSSYTLDAACASSLYAIKLACDALQEGRCDAALAGGVSRPDHLYTQMGFSQLRALSTKGFCTPFDHRADGLLVGEGAAIFVLRRLEDALRDHQTIYGIVRGVGLSNDIGGRLLAPDSEGQLRAMRAAYHEAQWDPQTIDLIECHATGTPVGDAVEFQSLCTLWGTHKRKAPSIVGSAKSNIGHLLTAAGGAGLLKVLFAMKHRILPPTASFERPSSKIDFAHSPFRVLTQAQPWETPHQHPRRAAVSAFGFGGINAHLLVEAFDPTKHQTPSTLSTTSSRVLEPTALSTNSRPLHEEPIAIVGLAAQVGGYAGQDALLRSYLGEETHLPLQKAAAWGLPQSPRWEALQGKHPLPTQGLFCEDLHVLPGQFRIPPRELEELLPQQVWMLQVADAALRDAKLIDPQRKALRHAVETGVYLGIGLDLNTTNYHLRWALPEIAKQWFARLEIPHTKETLEAWIAEHQEALTPALNANRTMGGLASVVASRIAREFRLGGPSFVLANEEVSGLRALEVAVRALQRHEIKQALVGAIDLTNDIRATLLAHHERPFSPDATPRPFNPKQPGSLPADGAVAFVLKRLSDALEDGDDIVALIDGIGVAGGGTPRQSQAEALEQQKSTCQHSLEAALSEAHISLSDLGHIEYADGTDPIEAEAWLHTLAQASHLPSHLAPIETLTPQDAQKLVKIAPSPISTLSATASSSGWAGAASGLLSLARATWSLQHHVLPSLPQAAKDWAPLTALQGRIEPRSVPSAWAHDRARGPRRSLVASTSRDGKTYHIALRETPQPPQHRQRVAWCPEAQLPPMAIFTGATPDDIANKIDLFAHQLHQAPQRSMQEHVQTWQQDEFHAPLAMTILFSQDKDPSALLARAKQLLQQGRDTTSRPREDIFYTPHPLGPHGEVAFVYPGSGSHFPQMGREIALYWPQVLQQQEQENAFLRSQLFCDRVWHQEPHDPPLSCAELIFAQVTLGSLVSDVLRGEMGLQPQAAIGYSLGESTALFSLRAWQDRDEMLLRSLCSTLFTQDLAGPCLSARKHWDWPEEKALHWKMGIINCPSSSLQEVLQEHPRTYLLIVNTPDACVIGGEAQAVETLVQSLRCAFIPIEGVTTVHCEVLQPVQDAYHALHLHPMSPPQGIRFYSGNWGKSYPLTSQTAADSILANALHGLDFPKVIHQAYQDGIRLFVEIGPGDGCSRMIGQILGVTPHFARSACVEDTTAPLSMLRLRAALIAQRVPLSPHDLSKMTPPPILPNTHEHPLGEPPPLPKQASIPSQDISSLKQASIPSQDVSSPKQAPIPSQNFSYPKQDPSMRPTSPFLQMLLSIEASELQAHATYLREAQDAFAAYAQAANIALSSQAIPAHIPTGWSPRPTTTTPPSLPPEPAYPATSSAPPQTCVMDRAACMTFATGKIGDVWGEGFAFIDAHPTRVRLPNEPLMLVDRVLTLEGEPFSLRSGRIVTEHDILPGAWYLDGGRLPTCIAVESGQADLMLSGYLGIDQETQGHAMYRLLDAEITFHEGLPQAGDVIHHDIRIERFFKHDETYLFRFAFDSTVQGRKVLTMRNGCAGFFSQQELEDGKGVVLNDKEWGKGQGKLDPRGVFWNKSLPTPPQDDQLAALRQGDLAPAFGPIFGSLPLRQPLTLPGGRDIRMKLLDRVLSFEPTGGRFGIGCLVAEMDIHPQDWFLTCHFVDDMVMPGTLMYECCLHTMRLYLISLGWLGEEGSVAWEPVVGIKSQLRCRGQVLQNTKKVQYEIHLKELGYNPAPFAIADALMYADGRPIVLVRDMSLQLTGSDYVSLERLWQQAPATHPQALTIEAPAATHEQEFAQGPVLYDQQQILEYAMGKPSLCFGPRYQVFDQERFLARLPSPPYLFMDRVIGLEGTLAEMKAGTRVVAAYNVPPNAWYFDAERHPWMPFAILLEIALQPCGWMAAFMGSAFTSDEALHFRNLGGEAQVHRLVTPQTGTLRIDVRCTQVAHSGGMIIQHYSMLVEDSEGPIYTGTTYFGFFSEASLTQQVGVRGAKPLIDPTQDARAQKKPFPQHNPFPKEQMRMLDEVWLYPTDADPQGATVLCGIKHVDPTDWFFKAHFYQDPVWPGSLGLEAMLQLMKVAAAQRWGSPDVIEEKSPTTLLSQPFVAMPPNTKHRWSYRGQVVPDCKRVRVEARITSFDDAQKVLRADGLLHVDGRTIYEMKDFVLRWQEHQA